MAAPAPAILPVAGLSAHGALAAVNGFLGSSLKLGGITLTLGGVLGAVIVLLLAGIVSWAFRSGLKRYARRYDANESAIYTLSRVLHYIVLVVGFLWALSVAGISITKFALFAGALGVGLGFGLQAIFANFISGLVILFDRSLKVGDFVELANGVHGRVRSIHIRATRVTTNDNIDILIPNSKFITDNVVNLTWRDVSRRAHIPFRVPYGADKDKVKQAALEAAATVPFTLTGDETRQPQVWLTGFGDSAIDFALVVWLNAGAARRYRGVNAAYNWALHDALEKYHLELPFPQRDLHVKTWLGLSGSEARDAVGIGSGSARQEPAPPDAAHARAENDAARSVSRDIARDAAAAQAAEREADRPAGIRDQAEADRDDTGRVSSTHTEPKGPQAHEQDD